MTLPFRGQVASAGVQHDTSVVLPICGFASANDPEFRVQRHRTLPIPESVSPVPDYPRKLRIYKTYASRFWQVQAFFKGKTYRKSLRTTNRAVALRAAKEFFHLKVAELFGAQFPEQTTQHALFRELVPPTLTVERARTARGELSESGLRILRNRLQRKVLPFFGDMPVSKVGYTPVSEFVSKLSQEGCTTTTIQQYLVAVRKVLNHAYANNLIPSVPKFPSIKINVTPRGHFSVQEYLQLVRAARTSVGKVFPILTTKRSGRGMNAVDRYAEIAPDLQHLIVFMVNSFVRPSDIRNLQHKHITVIRGEYTYLRLNLPASKSHDKPIVTMRAAVRVYEKLKSLHQASGHGAPSNYVFFPQIEDRKKMLERVGHQFKHIQSLIGIEGKDAVQKSRPLYSLRHSAITFRLLYGGNIDLLTLARNARTSVEMVEKFYASNLTAEMNIGLLQSKRRMQD